MQLRLILAFSILFAAFTAYAQQSDDKAHLPDEIVNAKTAYIINETGKAKFGDAIYKQIKTRLRRSTKTSTFSTPAKMDRTQETQRTWGDTSGKITARKREKPTVL